MYNPQKVIDLLNEGGYRKKELLDFMGKNWNGSVEAVVRGDIRASKLEKIADFFGIPIDSLFDRETPNGSVNVGGVRNRVHHFSVGAVVADNKQYEALIAEKDAHIAALQDTIRILKSQLGLSD